MSGNCDNSPENIWLSPECEGEREWCQDDMWEKCDECGRPSVKYIRADLHDATIAQQAAEIERLEAKLSTSINQEWTAKKTALKLLAERDTAQAALATARREAFYHGFESGRESAVNEEWGAYGSNWKTAYDIFVDTIASQETSNATE